ncbi:protein XRI1-like [Rutidosis leptorrhynchoides]|uniref:protein XRI1-like n=1 Tax=Rutidosis leptorrhynchoides TaxID=125765 RepID=UPI003A998750
MNFNCDENTEMWDWQGEEYGLQTNTSNNLWNNANENQDDLSYVLNETTPAKSFEDLAYQATNDENVNKGTETCRETYSQAKRRRMLDFDNEVVDIDIMPLCEEDFSSMYLKSKEREASLNEALSQMTEWVAGFSDDTSASGSGYEGVDQSSESWLADILLDDSEMQLRTNDMSPSESTAVQIDITDSDSSLSANGCGTFQELPTPTRKNITFKGKKSFIKTPTKMTSSVVLPFAFVKPCGMQGVMTLKDINQKIHTPSPSKSKKNQQDPAKSYPTSAFSGKPVVGKTKIHTEGGKGSITIMRTKG